MITIREVVFVASLSGVVALLVAYRVNHYYRWIVVAALTWMVHSLALYTVRIFWPVALTAEQLNAWSNGIRLHSILLVIVGALLIIADRKKYNGRS